MKNNPIVNLWYFAHIPKLLKTGNVYECVGGGSCPMSRKGLESFKGVQLRLGFDLEVTRLKVVSSSQDGQELKWVYTKDPPKRTNCVTKTLNFVFRTYLTQGTPEPSF